MLSPPETDHLFDALSSASWEMLVGHREGGPLHEGGLRLPHPSTQHLCPGNSLQGQARSRKQPCCDEAAGGFLDSQANVADADNNIDGDYNDAN